MMRVSTRTLRASLLLGAAALVLAGCAGDASAETDAGTASTSDSVAADSVSIVDAWVKSAESGMSAAFGQLVNDSDTDLVVVSATSPASPMIELHETVAGSAGDMVMQEIEGGFVIPAGDSRELAPGGDHLMFMGLEDPLVAGDEVEIQLTFDDDSTYEFTAVVKDYSGANENYVESEEHGETDEHSDHEHSEDDAH